MYPWPFTLQRPLRLLPSSVPHLLSLRVLTRKTCLFSKSSPETSVSGWEGEKISFIFGTRDNQIIVQLAVILSLLQFSNNSPLFKKKIRGISFSPTLLLLFCLESHKKFGSDTHARWREGKGRMLESELLGEEDLLSGRLCRAPPRRSTRSGRGMCRSRLL